MYHSHSLHLLRKRWALSQQELADLLSISRSALVRLESGVESIRLVTAHALLVVFGNGQEIRQTDIYLQVEEAVMNKAAKLDGKLRNKSDAASLRKLELLSDMVRRASGRLSNV
jgi:DNA-binding XRE family transcriptional regulator